MTCANFKARFSAAKLLFCSFFVVLVFSFTSTVCAQKRDNLTDEEDLQIRGAQEIDLRMKAYSKVVNRRLTALSNPSAAESKESQKDINADWGAIRAGTNADLFRDIEKTLEESISKIDDVAERDQKNPLFGKAVHILADNCREWIPKFKTFGEKSTDERERNSIVNSIDSCTQLIAASGKVAKEVPKESKDKKKKTDR